MSMHPKGPLPKKQTQVKLNLSDTETIVCEKCGHEFSATEHTQCPKCKEKTDEK